MSGTSIQDRQIAAVSSLEDLVTKINTFVNGRDDEMIPTDNGPLKTLARALKDVSLNKFIQKVVDYKTKALAQADIPLILKEGNLVRVFADSEQVNGYYQVTATETLRKIDFRDVYDLHDQLPNPWNYDYKMLSAQELCNGDRRFFRFRVERAETITYAESFDCRMVVKSQENGKAGVYWEDFTLDIAIRGAVAQSSKKTKSSNANELDGVGTVPVPAVSVVMTPETTETGQSQYVVEFMVSVPAGLVVSDKVTFEFYLHGLQQRKFY